MTTIMSKRKPDGEKVSETPLKPQVVKDEDGNVDGRHEAAQDVMAAFHAKDAIKLDQALRNHHDLHMALSKQDEDKE